MATRKHSKVAPPKERPGPPEGAGVSWLDVKNWKRLQHYGLRSPPWIKLYVDLLDDLEFQAMDERRQFILMKCWLVASRYGGYLPIDLDTINARLRKPTVTFDDLQLLASAGFLLPTSPDASMMLASYASGIIEEKRRVTSLLSESTVELPPGVLAYVDGSPRLKARAPRSSEGSAL